MTRFRTENPQVQQQQQALAEQQRRRQQEEEKKRGLFKALRSKRSPKKSPTPSDVYKRS